MSPGRGGGGRGNQGGVFRWLNSPAPQWKEEEEGVCFLIAVTNKSLHLTAVCLCFLCSFSLVFFRLFPGRNKGPQWLLYSALLPPGHAAASSIKVSQTWNSGFKPGHTPLTVFTSNWDLHKPLKAVCSSQVSMKNGLNSTSIHWIKASPSWRRNMLISLALLTLKKTTRLCNAAEDLLQASNPGPSEEM